MKHSFLKNIKLLAHKSEKWIDKASNYMYNFKDGHFQFPYAASSPDMMIEGFRKTAFVTHNKALDFFETNSPFVKSKSTYINPENGLWCIGTHIHWKVKMKVIAIIDEEPNDYFVLSYVQTTHLFQVKADTKEGYISNTNQAWTLYKSTTAVNAYFEKNSSVFSMLFFFTQKWLDDNVISQNQELKLIAQDLLQSKNAYKTYFSDKQQAHNGCDKIFRLIDKKTTQEFDKTQLKPQIIDTITGFLKSVQTINIKISNFENLKIEDKSKLFEVEKLLCQTLTTGFLGIDALAAQFKLSPTKLKTEFKQIYGLTVFEYYRQKQMDLSVQMLHLQFSGKQIAHTLGFENQHKFALRFKKSFGVLPSKYL